MSVAEVLERLARGEARELLDLDVEPRQPHVRDLKPTLRFLKGGAE